MAIYRYPSYCTIYDANIDGRKVWHTPVKTYIRAACYGSSLVMIGKGRNHIVHYDIILITDESKIKQQFKNNCRMSKHQLENYLRRITSIKPFKYHISQSEYKGSPCFELSLDIRGGKKEITFVLQCIKRTYEFPYNFYLEQAYKMQEIPKYKHDSILNLFNVVFSTFSSHKNKDHCFSGNTYFEKYTNLRNKMPLITYACDLYPDYCRTTKRAPRLDGVDYCDDIPGNTDQWTDALFERLLPYYIINYNELKR